MPAPAGSRPSRIDAAATPTPHATHNAALTSHDPVEQLLQRRWVRDERSRPQTRHRRQHGRQFGVVDGERDVPVGPLQVVHAGERCEPVRACVDPDRGAEP
ncbi:hypothetical protein ASG23_18075 [Cellulomonas sp. Leaf395]|nr:hypothetical protein ASG23_18075 [Cellulomonas sp. Leaf395]